MDDLFISTNLHSTDWLYINNCNLENNSTGYGFNVYAKRIFVDESNLKVTGSNIIGTDIAVMDSILKAKGTSGYNIRTRGGFQEYTNTSVRVYDSTLLFRDHVFS